MSSEQERSPCVRVPRDPGPQETLPNPLRTSGVIAGERRKSMLVCRCCGGHRAAGSAKQRSSGLAGTRSGPEMWAASLPGQLALGMLVWKGVCVGGGEDGNRGARKEAFGEKQDEGRVAEEDRGHRCGETDVGVGWATGREEKRVWAGLPLSGRGFLCLGGASSSGLLHSFSPPNALLHSSGPSSLRASLLFCFA